MPKVENLFKLHTATGTGFIHYSPGDTAYVTNGFSDNGVVGFVRPRADDTVYKFVGLAVSAFGEATVQIPPFIARGNGGSGLVVLEPLKSMSANQLGYFAAYINTQLRWRFSWSRVATVDRLKCLELPDAELPPIRYDVQNLLPERLESPKPRWQPQFKEFTLDGLFELRAGDYHNASELPEGDTPLISCGDNNNGIMAFVDVPEEQVFQHKLTISNDYILDLGCTWGYKGVMDDAKIKALLVEMVNLLAELTDEVEQLVNPTAGVPLGKIARAPGDRASRIQQKLTVVRGALKKVQ